MKNTEQLNNLLDLNLDDMIRECAAMGIDTIEHAETIVDMFHDGFDSYKGKEMVEVIQDRDHYAYIPEL